MQNFNSPKKGLVGYARALIVVLVIAVAGVLLVGMLFQTPAPVGAGRSSSSTSPILTKTSSGGGGGISTSSSTTTSAVAPKAPPSDEWLTYHGNTTRDGYDALTSNVTSPSFAWNATVDSSVYAEPLTYNGSVFIATENNTVYSFNAVTGALLWSTHVGTAVNSAVPPYACHNNTRGPDIRPQVGITGTPVIDPATGQIYVAALINGTGYFLYALNAHTGQQVWHSAITTPGFNYLPEEERGALALSNGLVYVPFGGYSWNCFHVEPYGWVFAVSSSGAGVQHAWEVSARPEGDFWAPEGPSLDGSGNVYVTSGDSFNPRFDFGNSVIKLTPDLTFINTTANFFSPPNWNYTNANDRDLGSTGATQLPGNLIFAMGKFNVGYLLNASNLGGIGGQLFEASVCGPLNGTWPYGAWGATTYANGVIYVPCGGGVEALQLHQGPHPTFSSLWNYTGFYSGPPVVAGGAVWADSVGANTLYVLNPQTGGLIAKMNTATSEHFTTPGVGYGRVFLAANRTIYAINPAGGSAVNLGASTLTIISHDSNGQTLTGFHTALWSPNMTLLATGFTPNTFATTAGQQYQVEAEGYGHCSFVRWSDGVTNSTRTFAATNSSQTLTAVYNCG